MFQIIIIGLLLFLSYYIIQNTLGWNGTVKELPAFHTSFIRQNIRKRNAVVIRNFLTEEAKTEYDEMYEYLKEIDPNQEKDIILNETTLSQIEACV
jgi:flagellar biosynthesis protein FliP